MPLPTIAPIVVIDNIDSFTYNLVHLCHQVLIEAEGDADKRPEILVFRNNAITLQALEALDPQLIIISPGPGRPEQAGITLAVIQHFEGKVPLFGVCLGMQALAQAHGVDVVVGEPVHGKIATIDCKYLEHGLWKNIPQQFNVVRYHSLHVDEQHLKALPQAKVLAKTMDAEVVMALETSAMAWGVQFHPESISSQYGLQLMHNVYRMACSSALLASNGAAKLSK